MIWKISYATKKARESDAAISAAKVGFECFSVKSRKHVQRVHMRKIFSHNKKQKIPKVHQLLFDSILAFYVKEMFKNCKIQS